MVIGLTGGSGSGKSTLSKAAEDLGYYVIDADKVWHNILRRGNSAFDEVVEHFGKEILDENGEIDRKKLGRIVFLNEQKLLLLNKISHEKITKAIENLIEMCDNNMVVIDAAVLFESGIDKKCDYIISVISSKEERIKRICNREGISYESAVSRIEAQKSDEYYSSRSDKTVYNNGNIPELYDMGINIFREAAHGKN